MWLPCCSLPALLWWALSRYLQAAAPWLDMLSHSLSDRQHAHTHTGRHTKTSPIHLQKSSNNSRCVASICASLWISLCLWIQERWVGPWMKELFYLGFTEQQSTPSQRCAKAFVWLPDKHERRQICAERDHRKGWFIQGCTAALLTPQNKDRHWNGQFVAPHSSSQTLELLFRAK